MSTTILAFPLLLAQQLLNGEMWKVFKLLYVSDIYVTKRQVLAYF